MKYLLLIFSLIILGATACKKDNTSAGGQLPDTSSSGKNFLTCKVNGKVQVYSGTTSFMTPNGVSYGSYEDYVQIFASGTDKYKDIIKIRVNKDSSKNVQTNIMYYFTDEYGQHFANYYSFPVGLIELDYVTRNRSGWIRFSRLDSVASGTFEFTAYYDQRSSSRKEPDTIRITEGRFDISRD